MGDRDLALEIYRKCLLCFQSGGMNLARVGPLPTVLVAVVFGIVFLTFAVIVVSTKISEGRLKLYSIIFWLFLVMQLYFTYAVQIHHHASSLVRKKNFFLIQQM